MDAFAYAEILDPESLGQILSGWRREYPVCGVFALLPEAESRNLGVLQEACRAAGVPLAGAIFPELLGDSGFLRQGVWLLRLNEMPAFGIVSLAGLPVAQAGDAIAAAVSPHLGPECRTLFMVFDAMVPVIGSVLDGLYLNLADRVGYAGVNAGSETFLPMPCLFDGERLVGDGVLWLFLPDGRGGALEHGYSAPERMMMASSTDGNRIISIGWRPAFEAYRELVLSQYGVELNPENFYRYASHFPFGILRANDEVVVRIPVALQDDGSLLCVGEIPANALLVVLQAPVVGDRHTVDELCRSLSMHDGPIEGRELLVFYCAGRRLHLGDGARDELGNLAAASGAGRIAGALSLGEIGNRLLWGYPLFHNAALVCRTWDPP
ncbi:MAG: FIST C-terminal domain-containing protein [Rhodocyclaceae bacterium]|nr:FIST C-terminal domain-containing protein [Rhodocyclaceae bacterium]